MTGADLAKGRFVYDSKNASLICHVSQGSLDRDFDYFNFICIQNIFSIYYGTFNIKYCQLSIKIILKTLIFKSKCVLGVII